MHAGLLSDIFLTFSINCNTATVAVAFLSWLTSEIPRDYEFESVVSTQQQV